MVATISERKTDEAAVHDPEEYAPGTVLQVLESPVHGEDNALLDFEELDLQIGRAELRERVSHVAGGLRALGVQPGDRVAALLFNGPAAVECWFATLAVGAIWVPVNTALRGNFLAHVLNDCGAEILVVDTRLVSRLTELNAPLPHVKTLVTVSQGEADADAEPVPPDYREVSIETLRASAPVPEFYDARPGDLSCLVYTAGTTGPSKGCMLPHNHVLAVGRYAINSRRSDEPAYTALPLFHLNAMSAVIATFLISAPLTIGRRFSVSGFWPSIERSGARIVYLLGPMVTMIANAPDNDAAKQCHGQLRKVFSAPFPPEAQRLFQERFGLRELSGARGYGLTEMPLITATPPGMTSPPGTSGRRRPDVELRIVDDDDNELPDGMVGEIVCRPKHPFFMFQGYWGRPQATLEVCRNLWFHTGDLGKIDEDGWFHFVDRKKDYLRRRGENISSMEVEHALMAHPEVAEVAVYGVPSEVGEDELQISVVRTECSTLSEEELCRWSIKQLPYFAVPRYIEFLDEMPRSVVGRARKVELRGRPLGYPRWDREAAGIELERS